MNERKVEEINEPREDQSLPSRTNVHKHKRVKTKKKTTIFLPQVLFTLFFGLVGSILVLAFLFLF